MIWAIVPNPDASVTLNCVSQPGSTNVMLYTTNLLPPISWQPVSTNVAGLDGNWQFIDTNAVSSNVRFYRSPMR